MIALTSEASAEIEILKQFHIEKERFNLRNLGHALAKASFILNAAERGLPASRSHP